MIWQVLLRIIREWLQNVPDWQESMWDDTPGPEIWTNGELFVIEENQIAASSKELDDIYKSIGKPFMNGGPKGF